MNKNKSFHDKNTPYRIAIVGSGPRGLSVLERLAARCLTENKANINIYLIDSHQVGSGRIWRTNQPEWYLMNTVADEVSAFSGPLDHGKIRPGAGPSLAEWWQLTDDNYPGPNSYAPRALHGKYMHYVLSIIENSLPPHVQLFKIKATVTDINLIGNQCRLTITDSTDALYVDKTILTTGHSKTYPKGTSRKLTEGALKNKITYIAADSAADMPLDKIPAASQVGIIGLGLSFFDVVASLTVGRGGRFIESETGDLTYIPSGKEPVIFSGSRSGLLIPARGKNQKNANFRYEPIIFTQERVHDLKKSAPIDFDKMVTPLIMAEINFVYIKTYIRRAKGSILAEEFHSHVARLKNPDITTLKIAASKFISGDVEFIDLDKIAHPFHNIKFSSPEDFRNELIKKLYDDIELSRHGNVDSPLKAALDVIRDSRALIRDLVDFGGLTPESHRTHFMQWYAPRSAFLSAGPPRFRTEQALALIKRGLLTIVGPDMQVELDEASKFFLLHSPFVASSRILVDTLIDARVPVTDIMSDMDELTKNLTKKGLWKNFVNSYREDSYVTGGVHVTPAPFHPIDVEGNINKQLYVLGIPSEHTRWFMQAGSTRPGFWTDFMADADTIASNVLNNVNNTNVHAYEINATA